VVSGTFGIPGNTRALGAINYLVHISCKTISAGLRSERLGFKRALRTVLRMRAVDFITARLHGCRSIRSYFNFPISGKGMIFKYYVELDRMTALRTEMQLQLRLAITEKLASFRIAQLFLRQRWWGAANRKQRLFPRFSTFERSNGRIAYASLRTGTLVPGRSLHNYLGNRRHVIPSFTI